MQDNNNKKKKAYMTKIALAVVIIAVAVIICSSLLMNYLRSSAAGSVVILQEESFLNEFEVIDDEVHIYCTVSLKNNSSSQKTVKISGHFLNEVRNGLLKEDRLEANFIKEASDSITIEGNSTIKYVQIEFVGEYAGNSQMSSRLLPDMGVIEIE